MEPNLSAMLAEFELGNLDYASEINLFAHLIKSGFAWQLNREYIQIASDYIANNVIDEFGKILIDLELN
jgi:hypothetical protein